MTTSFITKAHRGYLAKEAIAAIAINGLLSGVFAFVIFGRQSPIRVPALIFDALPQTFIVAFMSCAIPSLMARRSLADGRLDRLAPLGHWPKSIVLRSLIAAAALALVSWAVQRVILPRIALEWRFASVLTYKILIGAGIGCAVALVSARQALAEPIHL